MTSCSPALTAITAPAGLPPFISPYALPPMAVTTATAGNLSPSISHPVGLSNRVREILWHIPWYGFKTQARLAHDSGVSPAAISRLIRGESQPSLVVALHVTQALSMRLGRPLDVSEVFSLDGTYPTPSVCHLAGCRNCLPPDAYDEEEQIKSAYQDVKSGTWSLPSTASKDEPAKEHGETIKQKGDA